MLFEFQVKKYIKERLYTQGIYNLAGRQGISIKREMTLQLARIKLKLENGKESKFIQVIRGKENILNWALRKYSKAKVSFETIFK